MLISIDLIFFENVSGSKLTHSAIEIFERMSKKNTDLIRILNFNVFYAFVVF